MSSKGKIKFFKNKNRKAEATTYTPYVPQYQTLGVEPLEYKSGIVPVNQPKAVPSEVNPRAPRSLVKQPYAIPSSSPIGSGKNTIPNVGNNVEQTWAGVDGELIDDITVDPNHPMIDNNEFVIPEENNNFTPNSNIVNDEKENFEQSSHDDLLSILEELQTHSYLLLVEGVPICSAPKEEIEEQVQALIIGEHELCDGEPVEEDKIMVLKKISIKFGVSLE